MPLQIIIEANPERRNSLLQIEAARNIGHIAWVDATLQIRVQRTFAQFWQERLVSIVEPDAPKVHDLLVRKPFYLQSMLRVEHEPLPFTHAELLSEAQALFDLRDELLTRKVASLSNGELRRVLSARAFMESPATLVLDDPFGGLDPHHRASLRTALDRMASNGIIILLGLPEEETLGEERNISFHCIQTIRNVMLGETLVALQDGNVRFGDTVIFEHLDWSIHKGQQWILSGENGSGKSSLLAFLTADHPQIYRNQLQLLGRIPGQGLAVWEHKRHIGFSSPEQHHQWTNDISLLEIVASGCLDPRDPFGEILEEQRQSALAMMLQLGLHPEQRWSQAPYAWQRLALVARAAVRRPTLLILDEPDQGLDSAARTHLWSFLETISAQQISTLIVATHHAQPVPTFATHRLVLRSQSQ